ncbi:carotenoid oxygenase family protein [Quisquiliibacterium transsilvanicum]|uniref:Carotenoid cleavage dioxygenase-like enzyme n=1 Tax=Quisquiliibacterium transsilvanicum TaxID=1549638 RepID=A0A7W8M830_9BURK|nr:carotenoid oxygenase family protein [Quisquiliibacterium transsilvanicum]MBB5271212.1 carotenoid cleavage dioxygenase-like enzyme [Quisquiliibacterium transsilvanicum]
MDTPTHDPIAASGRARGFLSGAREIDDARVDIRGTLPSWLRGTHLLNGPALWELPGGRHEHWFDGYAMWHALRIADDGVRYRSRFALSDAYRRSSAAGMPVFGEFGSPNPAGLLTRLRSPQVTDNPAVVMSRHGDRWLSVTETPFLTYFDPDTLETQERLDLGHGDEVMHLMSAHGFTLADGSYLNLATALGRRCEMKLFRLRPGSARPEVLGRIAMPRSGYTHGFGLAPGHALIWETALRAQPLAFRFGSRSYAGNFRWEPRDGSAIHAVALDTGGVRTWRIPPIMAFHCTQAWGDGNDLVLELAVYDDAAVFDDLRLDRRRAGAPLKSLPRHVRYRLRADHRDADPEAIAGPAIELQQVHPWRVGRRRAQVCWGGGNGEHGEFSDRTHRIDLDGGGVSSWQRPQAIQLEPLFVPRPGGEGDDDGVLLVPTLADADDATVIGVLDARSMECLAELRTPQIVPFGFHAAFRFH